jgi:hypothetical protein
MYVYFFLKRRVQKWMFNLQMLVEEEEEEEEEDHVWLL